MAAVILLARYFAATKNNERTLLFVAFAGEELGLLGSKALSQVIQPDPIIAVINPIRSNKFFFICFGFKC